MCAGKYTLIEHSTIQARSQKLQLAMGAVVLLISVDLLNKILDLLAKLWTFSTK